MWLNFESLKFASKSFQTLHKGPNEWLLLKKLSSEYLASICWIIRVCKISAIWLSRAFSVVSTDGGIFVDLKSHHISSESLKTLHMPPNHCLEVKKLSLGHWWCTGDRFLEFTYGSNILPLSFMWQNSWNFENCIEIAWNSSESIFVAEKTVFWILGIHFTAFAESARFYLYVSVTTVRTKFVRSKMIEQAFFRG